MKKDFDICVDYKNAEPDEVLISEQQIEAVQLLPIDGAEMGAHKVRLYDNKEYPVHAHPSAHIIMITNGSGWVKFLDDKNSVTEEFDVQDGSVFRIPGNVRHQVGAHDVGMEMLVVSSNPRPLSDPDRMVVYDSSSKSNELLELKQ